MTRLALTLLVAALPLVAADWSNTLIGYRTSTQFREPGIDGTLKKNILELNHVSGWAYGTHFFNVDMLMSDKNDPAARSASGTPSTSGANEVYVVYRGSISLGKTMASDFSFGPVRDVSMTAGGDFNAKNNNFASKKRFLVLGPTFHFRMRRGFFDLGIWACHEQNYNGIVGKSVDYKTTHMLSAAWSSPFQMGSMGANFKGYLSYVGAKGKNGFGVETKPETHSNASLLFDISPMFGTKNKVWLGAGYEYWNNKFGGANHDGPAPATNKPIHAPMLQLQVHF